MTTRKKGLVSLLVAAMIGNTYAGIGPDLILNGGPSEGIPYSVEGREPPADADRFGLNPDHAWRHYFLRGIDYWKYERLVFDGHPCHQLTMDYKVTPEDLSYIRGDRYVAFIQSSAEWNKATIPVHIHSRARTILQAEVNASAIGGPGHEMTYPGDGHGVHSQFARMAFSTHPLMARAVKKNGDGSMTIDFDFWQNVHTRDMAKRLWYIKGTGEHGEIPGEYYATDQSNCGVMCFPVQYLLEDPENHVRDKWVKVIIDLSWAYEWALHFHGGKIANASQYTRENPPVIWRLFNALEGTNLKAVMRIRSLRIRQWDLNDTITRAEYVKQFQDPTVMSCPFEEHWSDYIQQKP